jgi:HSP20 family protein
MAIQIYRPSQSISPWSPFGMTSQMDRWFDDFFGRPLMPSIWRRLPTDDMTLTPAIDVIEKDDKFIVKAELPGMDEEDIDVSATGDTLTIKGERKTESEVDECEYYLCERSYGTFMRSMVLPSSVDSEQIEAKYENGVLEVTLPKTKEAEAKKIKVETKKKK